MTVEEWLGKDNKLGIDIWNNKYRNANETFDEWVDRVAGGEQKYKDLIYSKKFIPGGRILSNRLVKDSKVTYSNCYVIAPPEDNLESIYESRKKLARTYSYGGGCGIDISKLAPAGAKVRNQAKQSSGAVSFMEGYSNTTEEIGQNGRRGALMISMDCHHPDILEFIDAKANNNKITKANISVRVTDDFMEAVKYDEDWTMSFERPEVGQQIVRVEKARTIFDKLCVNNWRWGEPGILFWDTIEDRNLLSHNVEFEYAGTNPCAEEPLPSGGSCLLGSINLAEFVKDGSICYDELSKTVATAVNYLDEVLDEGLGLHPLEEQREAVRKWRQIGLGIMGLADMLIKLNIRYDSDEAVRICEKVSHSILNSAVLESSNMAKKSGPYPGYKEITPYNNKFFNKNIDEYIQQSVKKYGLRHSQLLTIAPTGSISTMLGVSGGIEPIYANSYTRKTESLDKDGEKYYKVYTPIVKKYMEEHNILNEEGLPSFFVTAKNMHYLDRLRIQAAWQARIDASISSTINLANDATAEDVRTIYEQAWTLGLKGITVFRDGCEREGILTEEPKNASAESIDDHQIMDRGYIINCSDNLVGKKRRLRTGCGSLHCTAWFEPVTGDLMEVYLNKGSTGGCNNFMIGLSRMISLAARAGVKIDDIFDQLLSTQVCPSYATRNATKHDTSKGSCCPMAVGYAIKEMYDEYKFERSFIGIDISNGPDFSSCGGNEKPSDMDSCPKCGEKTFMASGGCGTCLTCGYSPCN